jgi:hypothetical protein
MNGSVAEDRRWVGRGRLRKALVASVEIPQ